jgi:Do/DeqQ family serine protease
MTMLRRTVSIAVLVAAAFTASLVLTGRMRDANEAVAQNPPAVTRPANSPAAPVTAAGTPTALVDFSSIAERTVPAVVNISAQQVVRRDVYIYDPFADFFGRRGNRLRTQRGVENSLGSGVIVSRDGYILTNNHVVTGEANRRLTIEQLDVTVTLSDKREMQATLVGVDEATDLALLKVDATNLPTIGWGDSSTLKVAEWVLAIGNPYQLSQTVTLGIVSAVGRTNLGVAAFEDFIQTDAAINPGNSGGALVNARGELVGINTVIFSQSCGYQGIGFAVSSNLARRIFSDLQQHGEVRRGSIGELQFAPPTTRYAELVGLADTRGAVVYSIARDSAAFRAGIEPGDVIVAVNGREIADPGELDRVLSDTPIGGTVTLRVVRQGRRLDVRVPVVKRTA